MKITSVEAWPYLLPMSKPLKMSHVTISASANVLVKIVTDEGIVGWGEGVQSPDLTGETQGRMVAGIEYLGEWLIGRDPLRRTELWHQMGRVASHNATSVGAIDIALHDIAGKAFGVPVVELLGGRQRDVVPTLTLIGSGDTDTDTQTALSRHAEGCRWFKLKLAITDPATELATFASLREALGPDVVLCGDANQGWSEPQAARFLRQLDGLDIAFVEQPVAAADAMIRLAGASPVPICADEGIQSHEEIVSFARTGLGGVSLKIIKLGGITGLMRGAVLCEAFGLAINVAGKTSESSVAAAANVHAAAAMRSVDFGCSPGNQVNAADVVAEPLVSVDGAYRVPDAPGLGIEVDEDLIRALAR